MGLGWKNAFGSGKGGDTTSSGIEGAWTPNPTQWDNGYFDMLFGYDWNLVKSPSGAWQWVPANVADKDLAPAAHDPSKKVTTIMTTADLSLRMDPIYKPISRASTKPASLRRRLRPRLVQADPPRPGPAFALPRPRGAAEVLVWQDPVPAVDHPLIDAKDIAGPEGQGPRLGPVGFRAGIHRLGVGVHLPRLGQARRRQRRAHPPRAAKGLGGQPARATGQGAGRPGRHPA
jgi:catalase-peroxidase